MASQTPYARLVGTWIVYLGPAQEPKTLLDASPAGNWVNIGATDGDQILRWTGSLTGFSDNDHTGMVKHVRPEEGFEVEFSVVNCTEENLARLNSMATSAITTTTSGAYNVKQLPNKRGYVPTRYAMLLRGGAVETSDTMSAYLAGPAQLWIPQGVFDAEPEMTFAKGSSPSPTTVFTSEEDDTQSSGNEFGFLEMKSS